MALLSCLIYNEYYYFIVYWLAEIIRSIIEIIFLDKPNPEKGYYEKDDFIIEEELVKLILLNIADLLTGFLVLYTNNLMKFSKSDSNPKKESQIKKIDTPLIYNDISRFKHKIFLIPLISILDFIASSVYFIAALFSNIILKTRQLDWMLSIDIIARIIFSIIILKINVRKHHKLGIILCIVGFILMSFSDTISLKNGKVKSYDIFIYILIIFPKCILFPLVDVLYKIVLTNDFLLPHTLMFYRGVSQCGVFFIIVPLLFWGKKIHSQFFDEYKSYKRIIYSIFFTIISCIRNLCVLKVIYIFNSHYVSFLHAIIIFENTIRQFFEEDSIYNFREMKGIIYFIVDIFALLIISCGTLIFNEMVIINACGLNEKTKISLLNEEKEENIINCESFYYEEEEENESNREREREKQNQSFGPIPPNSHESDNTIKSNIISWSRENEDSF